MAFGLDTFWEVCQNSFLPSETSTKCCFPGDSGGPVFAGTIAFGVLSSCSWVDKDQNKPVTYATYTSVDYFNKLGVSIIVP